MKLFRPLAATLSLLALASAAHAQSSPRTAAPNAGRNVSAPINFVGFPINPFGQAPVDPEQAAAAHKLTVGCGMGARSGFVGQICSTSAEDWQNDVVTEGLKTWQLLCKKGRLDEAEQLAAMLNSLSPDNPKVRAACTATDLFKMVAARMAAEATPGAPMVCPSLFRVIRSEEAPNDGTPVTEAAEDTTPVSSPSACTKGGCGAKSCCQEAASCAKACCQEAKESCCTQTAGAKCTAEGCCTGTKATAKSCACGQTTGCCCTQARTECPLFNGRQPIIIMMGGGMPMGFPGQEMIHFPHPQTVMMPPPFMGPLPHPMAMCPDMMLDADEVGPAEPRKRAVTVSRTTENAVQPAAHHAQHVHLVTPLFEAHCERMNSAGTDRLVLEGDVHLTCKKHGQAIRIEGQRVHVNVKDGTFTVDSDTAQPVSQPSGVRGDETRDVRRVIAVPPSPDEQ